MKDPDFRQAKAALERLSADPEARILAEMRERALISYQLDISKARKEGFSDGRAEGFSDGRAEGFSDGRAEGKQEGRASLLMDLLSMTFGPLSPAVTERIEHASEAQLTDWARRVLKANSLEEVFGDS